MVNLKKGFTWIAYDIYLSGLVLPVFLAPFFAWFAEWVYGKNLPWNAEIFDGVKLLDTDPYLKGNLSATFFFVALLSPAVVSIVAGILACIICIRSDKIAFVITYLALCYDFLQYLSVIIIFPNSLLPGYYVTDGYYFVLAYTVFAFFSLLCGLLLFGLIVNGNCNIWKREETSA